MKIKPTQQEIEESLDAVMGMDMISSVTKSGGGSGIIVLKLHKNRFASTADVRSDRRKKVIDDILRDDV
jgi:hypothetical protein